MPSKENSQNRILILNCEVKISFLESLLSDAQNSCKFLPLLKTVRGIKTIYSVQEKNGGCEVEIVDFGVRKGSQVFVVLLEWFSVSLLS